MFYLVNTRHQVVITRYLIPNYEIQVSFGKPCHRIRLMQQRALLNVKKMLQKICAHVF